MKKLLFLFVLLSFTASTTYAEYYISYYPPPCDHCYKVKTSHHVRHKHKKRHHVTVAKVKHNPCKPHKRRYVTVKSRYHITERSFAAFDNSVYPRSHRFAEQYTICGDKQSCARYRGEHVVSFAQPEVYGEYCTTYQDVAQGQALIDQ
jgi:hypothetical protein